MKLPEDLNKLNFKTSKPHFQCVYSLGTRCYTEMWIKELDMRQCSSVFGSINMHNVDNLINCIKNLYYLIDEKFLIHANEETRMFDEATIKRGSRTFHKAFDDINNYEDATFAHHDLSKLADRQHFERAIYRFNALLANEVPTLFVCVPDKVTIVEHEQLVNLLGNKNNYVLTIEFNSQETKLAKTCNDGSLFGIKTISDDAAFNKKDVLKHLIQSHVSKNLLSFDEIDCLKCLD